MLFPARPISPSFDRDIVLAKPLLPSRQLVRGNCKRRVNRPASVMRRYGAARKMDRLQRRATTKQQKNVAAAHIEREKPRIARQRLKTEHIRVECARAVEIIDVKCCFDDTG